MYFIILILSIVILLVIMAYKYAMKVKFIFDTDKENMKITINWLYPFLKAEIYMENIKPLLKISLFNIKVYKNAIKTKKRFPRGKQLINDIKLNNINLKAYYGFKDKSIAGLVCGFINYASQFLKVDDLEHNPDFMEDDDYIYIEANANINIIPTLKSLFEH